MNNRMVQSSPTGLPVYGSIVKLRNAVGIQDFVDGRATADQLGIKTLLQGLISFTHSNRDIEMKGEIGMRRVTIDRRDLKRNPRLPYEIPGERSPRNRDVYFPIRYRLDEIRGRIFLIEIAEDAEADEIANDTSAGECMNRRKTVVLLTENVNADPQRAEARIVEGGDMQVAIAPRYEDIGGAIIGARGIGFIETCRHAHHNVANTAFRVFLKKLRAAETRNR